MRGSYRWRLGFARLQLAAMHDSCGRRPYISSEVQPAGRVDEDDVTTRTLLDVRQLLERLVGFDTTSRNSNLGLVAFVQDYLDHLGIASELVFDAAGAKANLLATIGPPDQAGIVLSGHTDVVPADGQGWSSEPFTCVERCVSQRRSTSRSATTRRSAAKASRACSII